jgi:hypothetical protein
MAYNSSTLDYLLIDYYLLNIKTLNKSIFNAQCVP